MFIDARVDGAGFAFRVAAIEELLYENEIYQTGERLTIVVNLEVIWRGLNVRSRSEAKELMLNSLEEAEHSVEARASRDFRQLGFRLEAVNALDAEKWWIVLLKHEGERRTRGVDVVTFPSLT